MISIEDIRNMLPHRYPFLFLDRVIDLDLDNNIIKCLKNVSVNENFFNGHFPDHSVMPGVLLIEAMAQAAGLLGWSMKQATNSERDQIYYLAGADKVRFRRPVIPGDQVILTAEFIAMKREIWKFSCSSMIKNDIVCSAIITCARKGLVS